MPLAFSDDAPASLPGSSLPFGGAFEGVSGGSVWGPAGSGLALRRPAGDQLSAVWPGPDALAPESPAPSPASAPPPPPRRETE